MELCTIIQAVNEGYRLHGVQLRFIKYDNDRTTYYSQILLMGVVPSFSGY